MIDFYRLLPPFWIQNYPTCREWDAMLNRLMDEREPTNKTPYTVNFGDIEVWIGNYPYSYGGIYKVDLLPKVATRRRLKRLMESRFGSNERLKISMREMERLQAAKDSLGWEND